MSWLKFRLLIFQVFFLQVIFKFAPVIKHCIFPPELTNNTEECQRLFKHLYFYVIEAKLQLPEAVDQTEKPLTRNAVHLFLPNASGSV